MNVRIDCASCENTAFACDNLRTRPDDNRHARLGIGIAGFTDARYAPIQQPDVGLVDASIIEDQRIGDDGIHRALSA